MEGLETGQLAKLAGVNRETVRYYERRGLLPRPPRTVSGYRKFPEKAVSVVRFIKRAQGLGFSLKEIKELMGLGLTPDVDCDTVRRRAEAKLKDVEGKIESLESVRTVLKELITACKKRKPAEECPILKSIGKGSEKS